MNAIGSSISLNFKRSFSLRIPSLTILEGLARAFGVLQIDLSKNTYCLKFGSGERMTFHRMDDNSYLLQELKPTAYLFNSYAKIFELFVRFNGCFEAIVVLKDGFEIIKVVVSHGKRTDTNLLEGYVH